MNVLFVHTRETPQSPVKPLTDFEAIQFGISFISANLKRHGMRTRLLVMTRRSDFRMIDDVLTEFEPDLVCFTAVASEYLFVERIARAIRALRPACFLLVGGVHVSLVPEKAMLDAFDALCIGEGEDATLELAQALADGRHPTGIANLWIRQTTGVEKNPTRPFVHDLDALPYPDREMWEEWIDMERSSKRPSLLLGRGCPFSCTYCCNHAVRQLAEGKYVRMRSPENIIGEMEAVLQRYPMVRQFYFEVETFGADRKWSFRFCEAVAAWNARREKVVTFGVNLRITPALGPHLDPLFEALAKAGCAFVNIGLEAGSERLRRERLRRNYRNEDIVHATHAARAHGIDVYFYNLIGLPTETIADFNETVKVNRDALPTWGNLSIFYPYPGTDLHKYCEEHQLLPEHILDVRQERLGANMEFPDFTKAQIQKAFIWFEWYVYRGHKPVAYLAEIIRLKYSMVYLERSWVYILLTIALDVFLPARMFHRDYDEKSALSAIAAAILGNGFVPVYRERRPIRAMALVKRIFSRRGRA